MKWVKKSLVSHPFSITSRISGAKDVTVSRCYVGAFVTSMEMAGVSLTLMLLDDDRKKYLGMNLITWTE